MMCFVTLWGIVRRVWFDWRTPYEKKSLFGNGKSNERNLSSNIIIHLLNHKLPSTWRFWDLHGYIPSHCNLINAVKHSHINGKWCYFIAKKGFQRSRAWHKLGFSNTHWANESQAKWLTSVNSNLPEINTVFANALLFVQPRFLSTNNFSKMPWDHMMCLCCISQLSISYNRKSYIT